ncbi:hypothetical protein TUBRATIS_005290 [Tubulinosema ratisbonensis]|uniref:Uncharacterized protein n=1 Tax=Tubulinosema ratisbonensis TaxID=291195 RepID=A0A437APP9_9MICR|nr:hypothetical protein TUBRATIS_005290 [Tubulinosema ratisbonensis]
MWSKNELNEIKFIRYLYEKYNKEVSLEKIYYNKVFSFHLTRTYASFKAKFYRMVDKETNSDLIEILDFDSRISYITKSLNLQLTSQFKKIYKYVILQDLLKLGIIE